MFYLVLSIFVLTITLSIFLFFYALKKKNLRYSDTLEEIIEKKIAAYGKSRQIKESSNFEVSDFRYQVSSFLNENSIPYKTFNNGKKFHLQHSFEFGRPEKGIIYFTIYISIAENQQYIRYSVVLCNDIADSKLFKLTELILRINALLTVGKVNLIYESRTVTFEVVYFTRYGIFDKGDFRFYYDTLIAFIKQYFEIFVRVLTNDEEPLIALLEMPGI